MTNDAFVADSGAGPIAGSASAGDGPNLLLLHGGPGLSDYMSLLDDETAGWRTITYQQRGLPPSAVDGPFDIERHVADAVAVLDALGVERTVVLGHSWGAHLALQLALAEPERVTAVVAVDGLGPSADGHSQAMAVELRNRLSPAGAELCQQIDERLGSGSGGDADLLDSVKLLWPGYFAKPESAPPPPADLRVTFEGTIATSTSLIGQLVDGSFAARLEQLATPTVLVTGADSPIPAAAGEEAARLIPNSELVVVPAAGHLPWHEQPGCVARVLDQFRPARG
ncbi:MAG TPA: alpha/beta hydrolase [Pseudonocardiaceae bacterium]|nr:alpha/beta hydrolase [Pseudonocardiaceae bacterium]